MIRMEIKTRVLPADEAGVAEAAQLLRQGQLVALPTETVYGIAADARNGAAVRNIFVAKGRPQDNPLIVHVTGPEMLPGLVSEVPERAQLLMAAFCPGPLTIIMPRGPEVADECCAGLDTVGIRMPSHPVARAVIQQSLGTGVVILNFGVYIYLRTLFTDLIKMNEYTSTANGL